MITLSEYAANLVAERVPDGSIRLPVDVNDLAKDMANACGCNEVTAKVYILKAVHLARYRILAAELEEMMDAAILTEQTQ